MTSSRSDARSPGSSSRDRANGDADASVMGEPRRDMGSEKSSGWADARPSMSPAWRPPTAATPTAAASAAPPPPPRGVHRWAKTSVAGVICMDADAASGGGLA